MTTFRIILVLVQAFFPLFAAKQPNIVFFLADDLGWADVGYAKQTDVSTPVIDSLAAKSLKLDYSYTSPVCTPSRASILSGIYPFRYGFQRGVLAEDEPKGLDEKLVLLPQKLKKIGYSSHLVGKWHLGYCKKEYTPTHRGFDTFRGFLSGNEGYYDHAARDDEGKRYHDYWDNDRIYNTTNYSTDDFTEYSTEFIRKHDGKKPFFLFLSSQAVHAPLEFPPGITKKTDSKREIFKAMLTSMDKFIGRVVQTLREEKLWEDTVFIFTSDNGGQPIFGGSNYPLRGTKHTLWEGGTRIRSFIHGRQLTGHYQGLFHAVDWLPTILSMAGETDYGNIDGINQWPNLLDKKLKHPRQSFIYNIDRVIKPSGKTAINAAVRSRENNGTKDYKLIWGSPGARNGRYSLHEDNPKIDSVTFPNGLLFDMNEQDKTVENTEIHDYDIKEKLKKMIMNEIDKEYVEVEEVTRVSKAWRMTDKSGQAIISPGWC